MPCIATAPDRAVRGLSVSPACICERCCRGTAGSGAKRQKIMPFIGTRWSAGIVGSLQSRSVKVVEQTKLALLGPLDQAPFGGGLLLDGTVRQDVPNWPDHVRT